MSRNKITNFKMEIRRFVYHVKNDLFSAENAILGVAVVICLILTGNSITAMSRNWQLSERLASEKKDLQLLEIEIETLELENDYYNTDEYKELAARQYANKKLAGEKLVYLPENSESAKNKYSESSTKNQQKEQTNFEKWLRFLFPNNKQ